MTRYKATPEGTFPFTPEEEAEWDAASEQFIVINSLRKASAIREERNRLLSETDWMANTDVTMSNAWKTYRQELRDITTQPTFPDEVIWPTKPQ